MAIRPEKLSEAEVKHIADLAGLVLTSEEVKKFQKQLTKIFEFIDLIGEMHTANVKETTQTTGNFSIYREDEIERSKMLTQEETLNNAPAKHRGYFKVKAILEK